MNRRLAAAFLLAALVLPVHVGRGTAATAASADTLATLLAHWSAAAGGNAWAHRAGTHLATRAVVGGVASEEDLCFTRDGAREVLRQGADRSETVRRGTDVWWHDWNGRTRTLEGRDRADGVTDAFLRALVFAGPSAQALAAAHPRDAGEDSTRTRRRVRFTPPAYSARAPAT